MIFRPLVTGLRSFATSTPLPSETSSSPRSLSSSPVVSGREGMLDGSFEGGPGKTKPAAAGASLPLAVVVAWVESAGSEV